MQEVLGGRSNCHPHRCALTVRIEEIFNCHHQHGFNEVSMTCFIAFLVLLFCFFLVLGGYPWLWELDARRSGYFCLQPLASLTLHMITRTCPFASWNSTQLFRCQGKASVLRCNPLLGKQSATLCSMKLLQIPGYPGDMHLKATLSQLPDRLSRQWNHHFTSVSVSKRNREQGSMVA